MILVLIRLETRRKLTESDGIITSYGINRFRVFSRKLCSKRTWMYVLPGNKRFILYPSTLCFSFQQVAESTPSMITKHFLLCTDDYRVSREADGTTPSSGKGAKKEHSRRVPVSAHFVCLFYLFFPLKNSTPTITTY